MYTFTIGSLYRVCVLYATVVGEGWRKVQHTYLLIDSNSGFMREKTKAEQYLTGTK